MVQSEKTKAASLVLVAVIVILWLCPIDVSRYGISQGCTPWQRLCYPFLHAGIIHAGLNCWVLLSIVFARNIALWRLGVSYLIAITYPAGLLHDTHITVGLSGVIFALIGTISLMSAKWLVNVATIVGFIIISGLILPHINWMLHLYCYLAGLLVSLLTTPIYKYGR